MLKKLIPFLIAAFLLISAVVWDSFIRQSYSAQALGNEIAKNVERELSLLKEEAAKIRVDSVDFNWSSLRYPFFLIDSGKIKYWNRNDIPVDVSAMVGDYQLKLFQTARQDLILYRKAVNKSQAIVGIIPLRTGYQIVNQYLTTRWNDRIFPIQGVRILPAIESSGRMICTGTNDCIFKIIIPPDLFVANDTALIILLAASCFVLWGIFNVITYFHKKGNYGLSFALLFMMLALMRIIMVQFSFPGRWTYSKFFDPKYFASSSFNASAGDFFLNSLIVFVASAYLFKVYARMNIVKGSLAKTGLSKWLIVTSLLTSAFFSFLFPFLFIEAIFHDSAIRIDITSSVDFDELKVLVLAAMGLGSLSSFCFVHIFIRWAKLLLKNNTLFLLSLIVAAGLFALYFLISELNYWPTLIIGIVYFGVIRYSKYFKAIKTVSYQTFLFLLVTVIAYGLQSAFGVWRFSEEKEIISMSRAATSLINRDILGEYLLNDAAIKITNDKFIISRMASPSVPKEEVIKKVRQVYLNNYFDRYDVKIKLFYADGLPADNEPIGDFASSIQAFQRDANKTSYDGVYFIRSSASETAKRYLVVASLKRDNTSLGYVVVDLSLKQLVPRQVYPELLVDSRFVQILRNKNYSYAFYNQGKLAGSMGNFNFERDFEPRYLSDPMLNGRGIEVSRNWCVGAEDETGKQAIVVTGVYPLFFVLVNFSFFFAIGVFLTFLLLVAYLLGESRKNAGLNYSAQIQIYVYLSFMLPLVVVSTIALRMINQSHEAQLEKEIKERGLQLADMMSTALNRAMYDTLSIPRDLQNTLLEFSQTGSLDANVYAPSGELLATSQPGMFNNQLLMRLMNRSAWEKIVVEKFNIVQDRSRIGLLDYNSSFFAIKQTGSSQLLGILELPFFKSNSEPARVSVLANILVTFVTVFLLFSFFAFIAIDKLIFPLQFIAKKLKTTSLGYNQPIVWSANDEIGLMVKEYNRMLDKLEQNKMDLARSQKESAWREIAQQVAHEIKNPLTPMKLTLQQMDQAITNDSVDEERTKKSIQLMLTQVDVLNEIAGSFSAFATMPTPVLVHVDIAVLLKNVTSLFENQVNGSVQLQLPSVRIIVLGDEQLLGRIFSNIILNAFQSGVNGETVNVEVTLKVENNWCIIGFMDTGSGISSDLSNKIFLPHFSTKQTGSGLGLAIAKQGIEQMGGTIWFETTLGQGTTFFVKLKAG